MSAGGLRYGGGSGGSSKDLFGIYRAGRYYAAGNGYSVATGVPTNGRLYAIPFWSGEGLTIDRLAVESTASASAGGVVRFGIYNDLARYPGSLLLNPGTADATVAAGALEKTFTNQVLSPNTLYWFAVAEQGAPGTEVTLRINSTTGPAYWGPIGWPSALNANPQACYMLTGVTGALPDPFTAGQASTVSPPRIFCKAV